MTKILGYSYILIVFLAFDFFRIGSWYDDNAVMIGLLIISGIMGFYTKILPKFLLPLYFLAFFGLFHGFYFNNFYGAPQINDGILRLVALGIGISFFANHQEIFKQKLPYIIMLVIIAQSLIALEPTFDTLNLTQYSDYIGFDALVIASLFANIYGIILAFIIAYISQNNSAPLALMMGLVLARLFLPKNPKLFLYLCFFGVVCIILTILSLLYFYHPEQMGDATMQYSLWSRAMGYMVLFTQTAHEGINSILIGHGYGRIAEYFQLYNYKISGNPFWDGIENHTNHTHNQFIEVFFAQGLVGAWLWGSFLWRWFKHTNKDFWVGAFLCSFMILSSLWYFLPQNLIFIAIFMGLNTKNIDNIRFYPKLINKLFGLILIVAGLVLLVFLYKSEYSYSCINSKYLNYENDYTKRILPFLEKFPDNQSYLFKFIKRNCEIKLAF